MEKQYFDEPKQVVFADPDNSGEWLVGIAYKDEIICACCGGIIEISEIYEFTPAGIAQPIFEYNHWCDITEDIIGGEMPDAWEEIYSEPVEEADCAEAWYFANLQDKED